MRVIKSVIECIDMKFTCDDETILNDVRVCINELCAGFFYATVYRLRYLLRIEF